MARSRNIKPAFFTNEELGTLDPIINLTFIGLWCLADKEGILEDRPLRIKAELFPYRESLDVNGYLTVLARLNFIERYEVAEKGYIHILNFEKHQSPHHTEKSKGYPKKPKENMRLDDLTVRPPLDNQELTVATRSDSLIPDSLIPEEKANVIVMTSPSSKNEDGIPDCPQEEIKSLYKQILPSLIQPRVWDVTRATALRARWVWVLSSKKPNGERYAKNKMEGLDFFKRFFEYVAKSDFLMGSIGAWQADLVWLCNAKNFAKVIDGNYENKVTA